MATLTAVNPKVVKSDVPMETVSRLILNGQSWKAGQFLYLDTNGYLNTCASDADAATGGIKYYALADQDDPAVNTTYAEVGVITADTVFEGNELDGAVTAANIGPYYGISVASNIVTVDVDDTGNDAVVITEIGPDWSPAQYVAADTLAKVRFKIIAATLNAENA
jgi:hypothetical protein